MFNNLKRQAQSICEQEVMEKVKAIEILSFQLSLLEQLRNCDEEVHSS